MKQASLLGIVLAFACFLLACDNSHRGTSDTSPAADANTSEMLISELPSKTENTDETREEFPVKIRIKIEELELTATMLDNATCRDFISMLPLKLTLKDYAETEKISDLPKRLSTQGVPSGSDPSVGDITYYAPWGNLAIFYKDFGYSGGLVILGKIDSEIDKLSQLDGKATFERMK